MSRFKTKLEKEIKHTVKDLQDKRSEILHEFSKAYMIEKDYLPSQIRLVEKTEVGMVSWHFAPLIAEPTGIKKLWSLLKFHLRTLKLKFQKLTRRNAVSETQVTR